MLPPAKIKYGREARDMVFTMSPLRYVEYLGFEPFAWQRDVVCSEHRRKIINGARQSGKSTIISALPTHKARFFPGSISLVLAPTERQAILDMEKIIMFIALDPEYPGIVRNSDEQIELKNGSFIYVVPATEKSARGYSKPRLIMIDEASRVEDRVYQSGILPMLTDNEDCELIQISTPNGRLGFFHNAFNSGRWEKYEVRSPWDVLDLEYRLIPGIPEAEYREIQAEKGVRAYYSPRHRNPDEQQMNLEEMGPLMYRQEYGCEFVEPEDQVFSYEEIERMFQHRAEPLNLDGIPEAQPLEGF
jgi:hypothetical protein